MKSIMSRDYSVPFDRQVTFPGSLFQVFVDGHSVAVLEGMVDNVDVNISLGLYTEAFPVLYVNYNGRHCWLENVDYK